jgi:hypothetical protein
VDWLPSENEGDYRAIGTGIAAGQPQEGRGMEKYISLARWALARPTVIEVTKIGSDTHRSLLKVRVFSWLQ